MTNMQRLKEIADGRLEENADRAIAIAAVEILAKLEKIHEALNEED